MVIYLHIVGIDPSPYLHIFGRTETNYFLIKPKVAFSEVNCGFTRKNWGYKLAKLA